jgi:hypothetical protein
MIERYWSLNGKIYVGKTEVEKCVPTLFCPFSAVIINLGYAYHQGYESGHLRVREAIE